MVCATLADIQMEAKGSAWQQGLTMMSTWACNQIFVNTLCLDLIAQVDVRATLFLTQQAQTGSRGDMELSGYLYIDAEQYFRKYVLSGLIVRVEVLAEHQVSLFGGGLTSP